MERIRQSAAVALMYRILALKAGRRNVISLQ